MTGISNENFSIAIYLGSYTSREGVNSNVTFATFAVPTFQAEALVCEIHIQTRPVMKAGIGSAHVLD